MQTAAIIRIIRTEFGSSPAVLRYWYMTKLAKIPERFALAIMERSIPLVMMVIIIAKARIPNSGTWKAIDCKLNLLRNALVERNI